MGTKGSFRKNNSDSFYCDEIFNARLASFVEHCTEKKRSKRQEALWFESNTFKESSFFVDSLSSRYLRDCSSSISEFVGDTHFSRSERWELLRRAKLFLSRRSFVSVRAGASKVSHNKTLLDNFPSLKYSYSAPLPISVRGGYTGYFNVCYDGGVTGRKARVDGLSRSHSIRLDPVDSPKQLYLYRLRIQRCITWAYSVGLVPVMMTLTLFHRWHPLKGLLSVLRKAWNYFFTGTRAATQRAKRMGLVGYIRRAEETINRSKGGHNSGWHPHYHVILFVPADKVSVVSDMEDELREEWVKAVNRYFEEEFGEPIDPAYMESFRQHGLLFSRVMEERKDSSQYPLPDDYFSDRDVSMGEASGEGLSSGGENIPQNISKKILASSSSPSTKKAPLRHVDDSAYVSKVLGCDSGLVPYAGDVELSSSTSKSSQIPFDLLCEDTAENNDLWVEYAMATKGVKSFFFSRGLEDRVKLYFEAHSNKDSMPVFVRSDKVVAQISRHMYRFFYRCFKLDDLLREATKGYDSLRAWCLKFYSDIGLSVSDIDGDMLPYPPDSCCLFVDNSPFYVATEPPATELLRDLEGLSEEELLAKYMAGDIDVELFYEANQRLIEASKIEASKRRSSSSLMPGEYYHSLKEVECFSEEELMEKYTAGAMDVELFYEAIQRFW